MSRFSDNFEVLNSNAPIFPLSGPPHQFAGGDEMDEFAEGVSLRFPVRLQTAKSGLIGIT
jgi:hypothetical protein